MVLKLACKQSCYPNQEDAYLMLYDKSAFLRFFFSSRRRHTRWTGDWSSDVCSSDLEAGFENRNLDLIFGLPNQTPGEWAADLEETIRLRPEHVSLYGLIVEEKTEFGRRHAAGRLPLPEEDSVAEMYELTLDRLAVAGYRQYEISNFARPGRECRHNRVYWQNEPYVGFGI